MYIYNYVSCIYIYVLHYTVYIYIYPVMSSGFPVGVQGFSMVSNGFRCVHYIRVYPIESLPCQKQSFPGLEAGTVWPTDMADLRSKMCNRTGITGFLGLLCQNTWFHTSSMAHNYRRCHLKACFCINNVAIAGPPAATQWTGWPGLCTGYHQQQCASKHVTCWKPWRSNWMRTVMKQVWLRKPSRLLLWIACGLEIGMFEKVRVNENVCWILCVHVCSITVLSNPLWSAPALLIMSKQKEWCLWWHSRVLFSKHVKERPPQQTSMGPGKLKIMGFDPPEFCGARRTSSVAAAAPACAWFTHWQLVCCMHLQALQIFKIYFHTVNLQRSLRR